MGTDAVNVKLPPLCGKYGNNRLKDTGNDGRLIVCMNWSPVTLLPHIVKALKQQHSGKNLSALAYVQLHWLSFQGPTDLGIVISQHAVKCQVD